MAGAVVVGRSGEPAVGGAAVGNVRPVASEEEAAAIAVAIEGLWPRPVVVLAAAATERTPAWRFSGRWWSKPVAARRDRPWY